MKNYLKVFSFLLLCLIVSCHVENNKAEDKKNSNRHSIESEKVSKIDSVEFKDSSCLKLFQTLNADSIKLKYGKFGTYGVTIKKHSDLLDMNPSGHFGTYFLMDSTKNYEDALIAKMIVLKSKTERQRNSKEELVELIVKSKKITIGEDIKVGKPRVIVDNQLGTYDLEYDGIYFYTDQTNCIFSVKYDEFERILKFKIGRYSTDIDSFARHCNMIW